MNFCVNEFTIYYEKYGNQDKTILILPGWGNTRITFRYLIDVLKDKYTVYILDYPGFGNSSFPNRDLELFDYTDLIYKFIISKNIKNPIILAHSFGGRIVIDLFKRYKVDISNIILIDIAGIKPKKSILKKFKEKCYKFLKRLGFILPKRIKHVYLEKLIKIFGSTDYSKLNPNIRKTFINIVNYDQKDDIKYINSDALIIWGELDKDVPLKDGYFINKNIKDSGIIVVPKSGHFPYLDRAYYVNSVILEYLKRSFL
jgi:pimeloyl-ACP methyl ester carboxylesterase